MPDNEKAKYRLEVIKIAKEIGISKAAEIYKINRKTITRWMKRFNDDGTIGLTNKSKQNHYLANKMPKEIEDKIISMKFDNPALSASEIIDILKLNYSKSTVYKKVQKAKVKINNYDKDVLKNMTKIEEKRLNKERVPFKNFIIFIKQIKEFKFNELDFNNSKYDNMDKDIEIPSYQITIEDFYSKIQFIGFAYEKTNLDLAIYTDFFLFNLKKNNIDTSKIAFYTKEKLSESIKEVIVDKYNSSLYKIIDKSIIKKTNYKIYNNLVRDVYTKDNIKSKSDLIVKTFSNLIYYNTLKLKELDKVSKTTSKIVEKLIHLLLPIITEDHISAYNLSKRTNKQISWNKNNKEFNSYLQKTLNQQIELADKHLSDSSNFEKSKFFYNSALKMNSFISKTEKSSSLNTSRTNDIEANINVKIGEISKKNLLHLQALEYFNKAITTYKRNKDFTHISEIYGMIGREYDYLFEKSKARLFFNKQLHLAVKIKNVRQQYMANMSLAYYYDDIEKFKRAKLFFREALKNANLLKEKELLASTYMDIGVSNFNVKNYSSAQNYLDRALELADDSDLRKKIISNKEICYSFQGKYEKMIEIINATLKDKKIISNKIYHLNNLNNLLSIKIDLGHYKDALEIFDKILNIAGEINEYDSLMKAHLHISDFYDAMGKHETSLLNTEKAIKYCEIVKNNEAFVNILLQKADTLFYLKRFQESNKTIVKAIKLAKKFKLDYLEYDLTILKNKIEFQGLLKVKKTNQNKLFNIIDTIYNEYKQADLDTKDKAFLSYEIWSLLKLLVKKDKMLYNDFFEKYKININEMKITSLKLYKRLFKKFALAYYKRKINNLKSDKLETGSENNE